MVDIVVLVVTVRLVGVVVMEACVSCVADCGKGIASEDGYTS